MRILLDADPLLPRDAFHHEDSPWPAKWVGHPEQLVGAEPMVIAYRRRFSLREPMKLRLHVSADERYELFLDGRRVGRGPERGDRLNWFYETYEEEFGAGEHAIVSRTWWLGAGAPSPYAQISVRPGFFLMAEDRRPEGRQPSEVHELMSTGVAKWECKRLGGYSFEAPQVGNAFLVSGAKVKVDGRAFDWGFERGEGEGWVPVREVAKAPVRAVCAETPPEWLLRPATLPAMIDERRTAGVARFVAAVTELDNRHVAIRPHDHRKDEAAGWDAMLRDGALITIPPRTMRRVIVDLQNYFCAFPELTVSGGAGATVRVFWAESLYEDFKRHVKGNRDAIDGKFFHGIGDTFLCDGQANRIFSTLWWEAGRYVEIVVKTEDQPLTINGFVLREEHYPHKFESTFTSSDARLEQVTPIALRTLEMCSHETYMDCPYYEQLMYVGDTRLQVLVTYATTRDDSLPRKAMETFDYSRSNSPDGGLTMARYPSRVLQTIPPFSLWWVAMVHDYATWREDIAFVRARMPGVRAVLDAFRARLTKDNLIESPPGWNFVDWVNGWPHGMPPNASTGGVSGTINAHVIYTLRLAAELEAIAGEPELSSRNTKLADRLAAAFNAAFFDEQRSLYAEEPSKKTFTEHAQCLALLGGAITDGRRPHVADALCTDEKLARTTIYFSHYLFEAYRSIGRLDLILPRMDLWFGLAPNGNKTTIEMPEPTRSDCHAWGAHPVYHYFASIMGIRPDAAGFKKIRITPQLAGLKSARGTMVHPRGEVALDVQERDGKLTGEVRLPAGVCATLHVNGQVIELPAEPQHACFMPHPF
jgi:alpha-L-rhamnosidase